MRLCKLTLLALVAASCDSVMTPETMNFHPTVANDGTCETSFEQFRLSGLADVSRGAAYSMGVTIENPLTANTSANEFRTNTNDVFFTSVEITYTAIPAGSITLPPLVHPVFMSIAAGGRATVEGFTLLSAEATAALNASTATTGVVASVVFVGRTSTNQTAMRTSPAPFPIAICRGCAGPPLECGFVQDDGTVVMKKDYVQVICPNSTSADPEAWTCIKQDGADNPTPGVESIEVTPPSATIAVGQRFEITVEGTLSDTTKVDVTRGSTGTTYRVRSSDIASVSVDGIVTALAVGSTNIDIEHTDSAGNKRQARFTVTVTAAAP